ncbi:MAG: alpha-mannosidase [Jiangellaceae bacterium]
MLDDVVAQAETDPDFRFTVDGQMAAVDDYLEMRPDNRDRVSALVRRGQLAVGPWHILLDEFLCSGETIVRNLELGWRGAAGLGGAMPVGYLPDMFGHCAQMPQILARAGIGHACLWRGVPAGVDRHAFRWVAPDGSAVRVEYLFDGYGNALDLFAFPERLGTAVAAYREVTRDRFGDDAALGMLGTDHSAPRPDLMRVVHDHAGPVDVTVATLAEYVLSHNLDNVALLQVTGEMRSSARANILPGVISVRVALKQAMARAERVMADAESVAAQWSQDPYQRFVDLAWRRIVECTAHDSVTGCGVDETAAQVAARLAEATQIGRAVRDRVVRSMAAGVPSDAHLVVNPLAWPRTVLVELDVAAPDPDAPVVAELADGTPLPVHELSRAPTLLADAEVGASDLERVLRRIHGRELFGQRIEGYDVRAGCLDLDVTRAPSTPGFDLAGLRSALAASVAGSPGAWRVRIRATGRRRVLVAVPVPASGHVAVRTAQGPAVAPVERPVVVAGSVLDNGDVHVDVADDGTLTIRGADGTTLSGVARIVDGGDRGDSYNYAPPGRDVVVDAPAAVRLRTVEAGPLRGIVEIVREYDWPASLGEDLDARSERTVRIVVTTLVELRVGEPFVRLDVTFTNLATDHRVRLHVPLPSPVTTSAAEGQFAVTGRGLEAEGGGWGEYPIPTFPASAFVSAGPATMLLDHVAEYEVVSGGTELALTLLRAAGWLSLNVHPLRDEPAGPQIVIPGAQSLGEPVRTRLALLPSGSGWAAADAVRLAEEFRHDALTAPGSAPPDVPLPAAVAGIAVSGTGVAVSALRARDGGTEVRLVAMSHEPTAAVITGRFGSAARTDLLGRALEAVPVEGGRLTVDLGPWEIATIRIDDQKGNAAGRQPDVRVSGVDAGTESS